MTGPTKAKVALLTGAVLWTLGCSAHPAPQAPAAAAPVAAPAQPLPVEPPPGPPSAAGAELDEVEVLAIEPPPLPEEEAGAGAELESGEEPLRASLDAFESATALWLQGSPDEAIATLDRAWALMAEVEGDGDGAVAQEKDNLRQLISRRVIEIYASRQTAVGDLDRSIPHVDNDEVRREIASFQGREREFFLEAYRRSGLYRPMIVARLEAAGLPEQLSWLPLVESGFKERALSRARALGLWQFIASTGYRYGLRRTDWVDERMDPEKATAAAIGYLTDLHNLTGDWLTALAAYNCGEGNVLRAIERQKEGYFDQFWDLYARLPQETRRYVPRFLATLAILEDPAAYGFELPEPLEPVAHETVEIARATRLESLDRALGLEPGTLAKLNPELRRNASPKGAYALKVPPGAGPTLLASVGALPEWTPPKVETTVHRVRAGETLSKIAARYRTSVQAIMAANHLRSAHRLAVGQRLQIPVAGGSAGGQAALSGRPAAPAPANGEEIRHQVRSGDTLWQLASRYGTTVERIRSENGLAGNALHPGQVLTIRAGAGGA